MLGGVGGEYTAHSRVEAAAENGRQTGLLEALAVGPLPGILEMSHVARLVVGRVEIVDTALQTGVHYREVLIRQGEIDYHFGLMAAEKLA